MGLVLVVDDKEMLRDSVGATLVRAGLEVQTAESATHALESIARRRPDCVITDLKMPGMSGIELLEQVRKLDDELPVILMTAFATVETAVKALKLGAFDYIPKPFEGDALIIATKRAVEHTRLIRENAVLRAGDSSGTGGGAGGTPGTPGHSGSGLRGLDRLVGDSPAIRRVKEQVRAVAESHGNVLVVGESGSGKEVVARAIHELSPRRLRPFLGVNCAALAEPLLESELFGHERGAFTGAERLRKGRFELADRGTLLLDEISEVSTRVQAKLLRVLQERTIERVGSSVSIGVDVRVVATSNRDLPRAIERNEFRQDLFFRLNVLPIHLPPLRDRLEDVPSLAQHFVADIARRDGKDGLELDAEALLALQGYSWPGNVRELQNVCERAAVLCRGGRIARELIAPWLVASVPAGGAMLRPVGVPAVATLHGGSTIAPVAPLGAMTEPKPLSPGVDGAAIPISGRLLEDIERDAIVSTLVKFKGHRQKTAQALGIGVRTLGLKLKKWKQQSLVDAGL